MFRALALVSVLLISLSARAELWETVESFAPGAEGSAVAEQMTIDVQGRHVLVHGAYVDGESMPLWITRVRAEGEAEWRTVDTFSLSPGRWAYANGVTSLADGTLLVVGRANNADDIPCAVIRRSSDGGASWETASVFQLVAGQPTWAQTITASGATAYTTGRGFDGSSFHLYTRRSTDQGKTWDIVDDYQAAPGVSTQGWAVFTSPGGDVFVAGSTNEGVSGEWLLRRSVDGGASWETTDQFRPSDQGLAIPRGGFADANGQVYVLGSSRDNQGEHAQLRKSGDSGKTWSSLSSSQDLIHWAVIADNSGALYLSGVSRDASLTPHWMVRKSQDGGNTWRVIDDYVGNGKGAYAYALAIDRFGDLYVSGQVRNAAKGSHSEVRRLIP